MTRRNLPLLAAVAVAVPMAAALYPNASLTLPVLLAPFIVGALAYWFTSRSIRPGGTR